MSKIRGRYPVPTIGQRTISVEHRTRIQQAMLLINHHRQLAENIEADMNRLLVEQYQIDLTAGGKWNIDFATGVIAQLAAPQPTPAETPAP